MNRTGFPRRKGWVESGQRGLDDEWRWDSVEHCDEEIHIIQVLDLLCSVQVGDIVQYSFATYEICKVWFAYNVGDGRSILLYAHPAEAEIHPMTEEEWHELYGDMDLASRS